MNREESLRVVRTALVTARDRGIPEAAMIDALFIEAMPLLLAQHGSERAARFLEQLATLVRHESAPV